MVCGNETIGFGWRFPRQRWPKNWRPSSLLASTRKVELNYPILFGRALLGIDPRWELPFLRALSRTGSPPLRIVDPGRC